jgi:pyruvate kinase
MPSTAADDPGLVAEMVEAGMDLARVNCAHDEPASWRRMLDHVRAAASAAGTEVRVAMDLAGPKLRTGPLEPGPQVVKVKPLRDATGKVLAPGAVLLSSCGASVPGATTVPVHDDAWLGRRSPGEEVRLRDTRGARRRLTIRSVTGDGCLAELTKTTYFGSGTRLVVGGHHDHDVATVGELPEAAQALRLRPGDELVLTEDLQPQPVAPPTPGPGRARIGCTLPELFQSVEPGHRVFLDDGKIGGEVVERREGEVVVRITDAAPEGTRLRAEKGINVPDTHLAVPALTDKDVEDLEFVAANAEIVNLSFVRDAADVALLQEHLARLGGQHLGIVLKIETVEAFENLPDLLLEALRWDLVGVMIARGDLAVEAGYERLAEVQEEILWLCEAGHVPVIWATQVLDTLAKTGRPSRAEVSDAAMAERAECVMLNKGPYIVSAIATLSDILGRMTGHQAKKSALLRELQAWTRHLT